MKLNLGCGHDIRPGYLNMDAYVQAPGVARCDCTSIPVGDATVSEILASDILEHFGRHETHAVLTEWARVLKPGGRLIVRVPDMAALCRAMVEETLPPQEVIRRIYGSQDAPGMLHQTGFTTGLLAAALERVGLRVVGRSYYNYNVTIEAVK